MLTDKTRYDGAPTEDDRSKQFLARHDNAAMEMSGVPCEQTRTPERVAAEIAAQKEVKAARYRLAKGIKD